MACSAFKVRFSAEVVGGEQFLDDDNLIVDLAEADQKIAMRGRGVDFVAELGQGGPGGFEPFGGGERQQSGLVGCADEIKSCRP